jgi:hypothetical protein
MRLSTTKLEEIGITEDEGVCPILRKYYPVALSLYEKLRAENMKLPFHVITLLYQIEQQYPSSRAIKFGKSFFFGMDPTQLFKERMYLESHSSYRTYFSPPSYSLMEDTDTIESDEESDDEESDEEESDDEESDDEESDGEESSKQRSQEVFITACVNDHEHIIYLLQFDSNLNFSLGDWIFGIGLSHLAKNGNIAMLEYLLSNFDLPTYYLHNFSNWLYQAAKHGHVNIVRMLLKKFDGLRAQALNDINWNDEMIDSLREVIENNYFTHSIDQTEFLRSSSEAKGSTTCPINNFIDIIRRGQWEVFSLLVDYCPPEKWENPDRTEQAIRNSIRTKDWRFVEALLKRPFMFYDITLWSWSISEALNQKDPTMLDKIVNYMKTEKHFTQDHIDEMLKRANVVIS